MRESFRIYVDTNVLIGAFNNNRYDKECLKYLFNLKTKDNKIIYVSSLGIVQFLAHLKNKKKDNDTIKSWIKNEIINRFIIVSCTEEDVKEGINDKDGQDLEDNIHIAISKKVKCQYIVTNDKHYNSIKSMISVKPRKIREINF